MKIKRPKACIAGAVVALGFIINSTSLFALSSNDSNYYQSRVSSLTDTFTPTGNEDLTDSRRLNEKIAALSRRRSGGKSGGTLTVRGRNVVYLREIIMRSNVHLKFQKGMTIKAFKGDDPSFKRFYVFRMGATTARIQNVAITSTSGRFNVEIPSKFNFRAAGVVDMDHVSNFLVRGMNVREDQTTLANIELESADVKAEDRVVRTGPKGGVIRDMTSRNNVFGYGNVQIRTGENILFKKIIGTGGIPLRIETDPPLGLGTKNALVKNIAGRTIELKGEGQRALYLSPHRADNGIVDVRFIDSSGQAALLSKGFLDRKGTVDNIGVFSNRSFVQINSGTVAYSGDCSGGSDRGCYPCVRIELPRENGRRVFYRSEHCE